VRTYVPALGRFLQPDPRPGGSADAYAYTFGDPLTSSDPSGEYTAVANPGTNEAEAQRTEEDAAELRRLAEEAAAREEAERQAQYAAMYAGSAGPQYEAEGVEEWEEWEEEGEYEYAAYHPHAESGTEEHHLESGVLYESLGGEAAANGATSSTMPLCEAVAEGPCARLVPDDHSPNVQSQCNRTGQHCSGHRGGGRRPSGNSPVQRAAMRCVMGGGLGADGGPLGAAAGCVIGALWEY
jgi:hypothetical protein